MIVAPTAVGPVHVSFVSNPWACIILTKDTFESKIFVFFQVDSIWWNHTWYELGAYRETTYCVLSIFVPIGIQMHRSAVTAMQQPSTSRSTCFAYLSRHLAYRAVVANMGLRPPLFVLKRHSRGTLWYDHSAVWP